MKVEQIYTGCLAQGAYYIESNGEAAIIDPLREIDGYIEMANERNAKIKYVFETHFHADFVSGHVDLAKKTGAEIVYGPTTMETGFEFITGKDGQEFKLGNATFTLIHTPGHTMESMCLLLKDENGKETSLFTGDTLFIGDVGRPDLAQKVIPGLTQDKLARHLYDSLRNKIMPLNDDLIIYPGHGAGSACGKMMSDETTDTLGHQKETNYALRADMTEEEFVDEVLTGLMPPPGYFPQNVLKNIQGYDEIDNIIDHGATGLSVEEFQNKKNNKDVVIIDTREAQDFAKGYVKGSVNIGIDGSFATWVGTTIVDISTPILIVADEGREREVATRLARIGFDQTLGYLKGGVNAWEKAGNAIEKIETITADALFTKASTTDIEIVDVRKASEFDSEHVEDAINAPLDYYENSMDKLDKNKKYYVHCKGGYRSMVFISLLKSKGFEKLVDVEGGIDAIKKNGKFKVSEYAEQTTML